jgi:protein-disulfide isomerase
VKTKLEIVVMIVFLLLAGATSSQTMPSAEPSASGYQGDVKVTDFPLQGNAGASVAIIEYADFDCPFCRHYKNDIYPRIFADYIKAGKIKYFWQDFPLRIHAQALWAARAARCAGEQGKFWEMRDVLFNAFPNSSEKAVLEQAGTSAIEISKLSECLSSERYTNEVFQSIAEGQKLGVNSTPTFFLGTIDPDHPGVLRISKVIRGAYPFPVFEADLDELLASHSQQQTSSTHSKSPQ